MRSEKCYHYLTGIKMMDFINTWGMEGRGRGGLDTRERKGKGGRGRNRRLFPLHPIHSPPFIPRGGGGGSRDVG